DRRRRRRLLVADAGGGGFPYRRAQWRDQVGGLRYRGVADRGIRGLRLPAHRGRRVARDHPHRRHVLAGDPRTGLRAYLLHVPGLMMNRTALDLWVGIFVAIGFAALIFLAMKVGNFSVFNRTSTYVVTAQFDNIGGLKVRAPVKSAGVLVGRVSSIGFDAESYRAE